MLMVQVDFRKDNGSTITEKVVWVDASWDLKPGNLVEFCAEPGIWKVMKVYKTQIAAANLNKKWGLDLPKSQRTER